MDARMYAVTDGNVPSELVELIIYVDTIHVTAGIGVKREAVGARLDEVSADIGKKRSDLLTAVEEEFQSRDTCSPDCAVAGRITRMRRGPFRKRLRQKIRSILRVNDGQDGRIQNVGVKSSCRLRHRIGICLPGVYQSTV